MQIWFKTRWKYKAIIVIPKREDIIQKQNIEIMSPTPQIVLIKSEECGWGKVEVNAH